jgi:hypothetical protein
MSFVQFTVWMKLKCLMIFSYIDNPSYGNPDGMCEDIMKNDFELKRKRVQLSVLSTQVCFLIDF